MFVATFRKTFLLVPLLVAAAALPLIGYSGGAPSAEGCNCHLWSGGDGSLEVSSPSSYEPGETYTLVVTLDDPVQLRWGFRMKIYDGSFNNAGTFSIIDPAHTMLLDVPPPGLDYVTHSSSGTYPGTPGPVTWAVGWTAPADVDFVVIEVWALACDNDGTFNGDTHYHKTVYVLSAPQPCGDVNCDDTANISDAVYLIQYIFNSGPAPCEACP